MTYCCHHCKTRIAGINGQLLVGLPGYIRQAYPVEPRFANGPFHFDTSASDEIDCTLKTYGNGDFCSKKMLRMNAIKYTRSLEYYLSTNPTKPFPSYNKWTKAFPPSGQAIREYYVLAEQSPNQPYGYSNVEQYNRELQSVTTTGAIAIDWTFQVTKNYLLLGSKACFTMCTDTGEVAALALVNSTAVSQVSHMLQEIIRRWKAFQPSVLYTDTWPHNNIFCRNIFGFGLIG